MVTDAQSDVNELRSNGQTMRRGQCVARRGSEVVSQVSRCTMNTLLVLAAVLLATPARGQDLSGAKTLSVVPQTEAQLKELIKLFDAGQYDFWREPRDMGMSVDIMATASQVQELTAALERSGLKPQVKVDDVAQMVMRQNSGVYSRGARSLDWEDYHDSYTINRWMAQLASDHPDLCTLETVGKSYEGRPMNLLTVGKGGADKPGIFIDGGIHAREWISPATVTFLVNQLVTNSSAHDDLLSSVNFYFMPVINPDGYDYSFTDDRLWRKTRSEPASPGGCSGADANRNWDFHWMEAGTSNDSCVDNYGGSAPFSEVEMQVVRDQLTRLRNTTKVYLTFHSYGQKWMYPWGYTAALPEDWQDLDRLARDAVGALKAVHGTRYQVGSSTRTIYAASGGSDDWAKGVAGIKYCYTVELRDLGTHYFTLPPSLIIPSGQETFAALKVIANFVKKTYSD
ncbi:carboxypeptidase B-like [Scylla paramamosain]|uniref:carboxypeptidase B-like n=1 Tax=Scylla paramamosain TaxID=85552 RepID=UPI0030829EFD